MVDRTPARRLRRVAPVVSQALSLPVRPRQTAVVAGHFGELLQGRLGPSGPLALVTLPAPALHVVARFAPASDFRVRCLGGPALSPDRAAAVHGTVVGGTPRGRLAIAAGMPVGGGAGSSTAAILAAAAAMAAAHDRTLPDGAGLAGLCLRLEGATDPLMYPEPARLLWAPRAGRILHRLPALPPLEIVGGFLGPGQATDPQDDDFADVSDLAARWPDACADPARIAALSTESARRNARHRGAGGFDALRAAAARFGALGVVAAHTGSARGLIFAPGTGAPEAACAGLAALGAVAVSRFRAGGQGG